jgi:ubiquinone biosynthesis protein
VPGHMAAAVLRTRRALALLWAILRYGAVPLVRSLFRLGQGRTPYPVRFRLALVRLGLTYVKLGQYLAMRFDILPPEVCRELGKLFDEVPPFPFERARVVVEEELGANLEALFLEFRERPMAAASVAQVHEAWTRDGRHVAVKIQRPGIVRVFRADIGNLRLLARLADAFHVLGRLSVTEMLDQFARWTLRETDFVLEGRTADRVGEDAAPFELIPEVFWHLTSRRVLTLEFIDGVSLAHLIRIVDERGLDALPQVRPDIDIDLVLHRLAGASLRQIFLQGLFHGDPHPGNILVASGQQVAFVDFGIFGELVKFDRDILTGFVENVALGNIEGALRYYVKQLTVTDESDMRAFAHEARLVLRQWHDATRRPDAPLAQRHVAKYVGAMIDISRRYRLRYDMDYLLFWRAINALDSTALRLSDHFDLIGELRSFFEEIRPDLSERVLRLAFDQRSWATIADLVHRAPTRIGSLVEDLSQGRFKGTPLASESPREGRERDRALKLLVSSTVAASLMALFTRIPATGGVRTAGVTASVLLSVVSLTRMIRA